MKTTLTIGQSAKLIELGVDAKLASKKKFVDKTEEDSNQFLEIEEYPLFSLTDLLSILPKEIKHKGGPYGLDMNWDGNWIVSYFNAVNFITPYKEGFIAFEQAPELIDSLYQLLIWTIEQGHLKTEKK